MDHMMCHGDKRKLFPGVALSLTLSLGLVMALIFGAGAWGGPSHLPIHSKPPPTAVGR